MKLVSDKSKVSSRDHCRSDPVRVQSTQAGVLESLNEINCNKDALVCFSACLLACLGAPWRYISDALMRRSLTRCWAEAPVKIARMTLTIKLDRNWSSFQLANSAPPLSVTDSAIAPSARMTALAPPVLLRLDARRIVRFMHMGLAAAAARFRCNW